MAFSKNKVFVLTITTILASCYAFTTTSTSSKLHINITDTDLVSSTCNKTLYVQLCESSLRSDPRSESADPRGLAAIALDQSLAKGVDTIAHIDNLRSESASDASKALVISRLSDCTAAYSDALENLRDSAQALDDESYETLRSLVSAAMTDSETCEDGFMEIEGYSSPLTEQNQCFSRLCSNFLAIVTLLD